MRAKTALLVSLCLLGTLGTAQAAVVPSVSSGTPNATGATGANIPVNHNGQVVRSFPNIAVQTTVPADTATWAMMLVGLGAIGMGLRMRRSKAMPEAS